MAETGSKGIYARLRRLPGQLMLAFNTTAILVIVTTVLALVAMARSDLFAGNLVATMTEAVLSRVNLPRAAVHESAVGPNLPTLVGQSMSALPGVLQTSTCSAIARASSTSMPRYLTVLSILVWPSRSCTARKFAVRR
jgi:hypothetical protein